MLSAYAFFATVVAIFFILNHLLEIELKLPGTRWFYNMIRPESGDSSQTLFRLMMLALVTLLGCIAIGLWGFDSKQGGLAALGEFVGGMVNPILTFLTFLGLLWTVILQQQTLKHAQAESKEVRNAMKAQQEALERQNFEATFFNMLNLHNSMIGAMDLRSNGQVVAQGRDCFKTFYARFKLAYSGTKAANERQRIAKAYDSFIKRYRQDLGHYFRYLYNVIRFIEGSAVDKGRYMKLLRAQLSDYELLLLFYSCQSEVGENFKPYVEEYSLLDNISREKLLAPSHLRLLEPSAFDEMIKAMIGPMQMQVKDINKIFAKSFGGFGKIK